MIVVAVIAHTLLGSGALLALLRLARGPSLLDRVHPDGPDIWAQVAHAQGYEWATEVDDVLRRRTSVVVRGLDTPAVRERTGRLLAEAVA